MPYPRLTTDEQDALILAHAQPDAELAAALGLTKRQVILRRYNVKHRVRSKYGRNLPKSKIAGKEAVVRRMIAKGMSLTQMAGQLGVLKGTVAGFIRRRDLRPRAMPRPKMRFDDPRLMI